MTDLLHFQPLGSRHARLIQRLQKQMFAPDLREDVGEIAEILVNTEKHLVCNFSYGLFDDSRMVGYVFAYVESESVYHEREEDVLYLKEIVLLPGYESMMLRLFTKLFQQWSAFTPDIPLEAHVLDDSLRNWKRMVRVFRYYGLSLSSKAEPAEEGRPPYKLLRLDVDAATSSLAEKTLPLPGNGWDFRDGMSVTVVTEPREWLALKNDWDRVLKDTPDSNVFQSFDYLWQWWKYCGIWKDLKIIVIRHGETVIGIVPLMMDHFRILGRTVRKLSFITTPMEMSRPKLMFGHDASDCMPAFLAYLSKSEDDWDIIDIDEQVPSEQTDNLRKELDSLRYVVAESETLCPYIAMDTDWQGFKAGLSRKMRSNINRARRRIAELGEVRVDRVNQWPQLESAMDQYCEIETHSWKGAKYLDIGSNRSHYYFYLGLARVFGMRGDFELRTMACAGKPIAGTFGIRTDDVFQSLKIAHDQSYDKYSPGTVLESYELEDLFAAGVEHYEFMGSFLANKLRWTSTVHKTTNLHIYQRRPRLMVFFFVFFVFKRHIKKLLKKIGQFENVDRLLKRIPNNPFLRY